MTSPLPYKPSDVSPPSTTSDIITPEAHLHFFVIFPPPFMCRNFHPSYCYVSPPSIYVISPAHYIIHPLHLSMWCPHYIIPTRPLRLTPLHDSTPSYYVIPHTHYTPPLSYVYVIVNHVILSHYVIPPPPDIIPPVHRRHTPFPLAITTGHYVTHHPS